MAKQSQFVTAWAIHTLIVNRLMHVRVQIYFWLKWQPEYGHIILSHYAPNRIHFSYRHGYRFTQVAQIVFSDPVIIARTSIGCFQRHRIDSICLVRPPPGLRIKRIQKACAAIDGRAFNSAVIKSSHRFDKSELFVPKILLRRWVNGWVAAKVRKEKCRSVRV